MQAALKSQTDGAETSSYPCCLFARMQHRPDLLDRPASILLIPATKQHLNAESVSSKRIQIYNTASAQTALNNQTNADEATSTHFCLMVRVRHRADLLDRAAWISLTDKTKLKLDREVGVGVFLK